MRPDHPTISARLTANRAGRRRAIVTLTPLIDVVFILLVFFMLASSFEEWRAIDLSTPAEAQAGSSVEGALLVEVRHDGLRLSGEAVSLQALRAGIENHIAARPEQRVLVKPAPGVPLQEAVRILDLLTEAGIAELSLIRDPDV